MFSNVLSLPSNAFAGIAHKSGPCLTGYARGTEPRGPASDNADKLKKRRGCDTVRVLHIIAS